MKIVGWTVLIMAFAFGGFAGDGVVEINQQAAVAGGITPGDTPGFPVTLSLPGSYRLMGPLINDDEAYTVNITADDVTLDLAGQSISGPNTCTGFPVTSCVFDAEDVGVYVSGQNAVVRNGEIRGMRGTGIVGGAGARVEDMFVRHCGGTGIDLGARSMVFNCTVEQNRYAGILVNQESSVVNNTSYFNGGPGIAVDNRADDDRNLAVLVADNAIRRNGGYGLHFSDTLSLRTVSLYSGNVITSEGLLFPVSPAGAGPQYPRDMGDNLCNGDRDCDGVSP